MASIREVAKLAGVSPATVSRVINGTAKVDEEKKQRVLKAIEETDFKPNELARALFRKSSKIIGVIIPNIENPFFNEMARAIEEEAFREGYKILLCNSNDDCDKELANIQMLDRMNADGIVIVTNCEGTGKAIEACGLPVVVVDRKLTGGEGIASIESDHYEGGRMAMEHLIECGCRNIVCMRGPMELSSGHKRYQGYQDVCAEHGIREQYVDCEYNYESGIKATQELLKKYPSVDGIIASNDMAALAVYKVLHGQGYKVPQDIQIIGFDNIKFSRMVTPELTTVEQPIKAMGTMAARIIVDYVRGVSFQKDNIFKVNLIKRQTTLGKEQGA